MPNRDARNTVDEHGNCDECGQQHASKSGRITCAGHTRPAVGQLRPCRKYPIDGARRCENHGCGTTAARAKAARVVAERKARVVLAGLIPDDVEPVKDPIAVLARLAGEVDAVRAAAALKVNEAILDNGDLDFAQLAYLPLYEQAVDRLVRILDTLVKSNYLERAEERERLAVMPVLGAIERGLRRALPDSAVRAAVTQAIAAELRALPAA